jgi:Transglutaminase-like superfamily
LTGCRPSFTILNMIIHKSKKFWLAGSIFTLAFAILFSIRLGIIQSILSRPRTLAIESIKAVSERDTWMNIFQNKSKIGFSHSRLFREPTGYRLTEAVQMRINTMGMIQDINLNTETQLNPDFTLRQLDFEISSGRFRFRVQGTVNGNILHATTESAGSRRRLDIALKDKSYHFGGIIDAVAATDLNPGDRYIFNIFDPASMGQAQVIAEVVGREIVNNSASSLPATKVSLNFKGVSQLVWIAKDGDVVKETGLLGISLVKTDRKDALEGLADESVQDLTQASSVASNVLFENVEALKVLKIKIQGITPQNLQLQGGRQTFKGQVLTVEKESLTDLASELSPQNLTALEKIFLRPSAFIQSDHQKVQDLAKEILGADVTAPPLTRARKLVDWVHTHIEKRPVLSLPDALSTLENRVGDCNEHAVLLAALARAAGIPTRIEAGLVYLRGRFYYHAWNLMYLGKWVTADSVFGQLPADVSHLRLVTGSSEQQMDLMGVIGKIQLTVVQ